MFIKNNTSKFRKVNQLFKSFSYKIKQNYKFLFSIFLLIIILLIALNPEPYMDATFKGLRVWATIVLPSLFVFFVLTKLFTQTCGSYRIFSLLDKPFSKINGVKQLSGYTFFMSAISGYPLGAKLLTEFYNNNLITFTDAKKMISFVSISGPMFILGSLASKILKNFNIGIIILISHLLGAIINGFLYRDKENNKFLNISTNQKVNIFRILPGNNSKKNINEIVLDSIISVTMVGGFITICFTFLEFFSTIPFIQKYQNTLTISFFKGLIEVTNGCLSMISLNLPLKILCPILTGIISFGGFSVHLQHQIFLSKIGIKYSYFLLTKITHTIISVILSIIFSLILL